MFFRYFVGIVFLLGCFSVQAIFRNWYLEDRMVLSSGAWLSPIGSYGEWRNVVNIDDDPDGILSTFAPIGNALKPINNILALFQAKKDADTREILLKEFAKHIVMGLTLSAALACTWYAFPHVKQKIMDTPGVWKVLSSPRFAWTVAGICGCSALSCAYRASQIVEEYDRLRVGKSRHPKGRDDDEAIIACLDQNTNLRAELYRTRACNRDLRKQYGDLEEQYSNLNSSKMRLEQTIEQISDQLTQCQQSAQQLPDDTLKKTLFNILHVAHAKLAQLPPKDFINLLPKNENWAAQHNALCLSDIARTRFLNALMLSVVNTMGEESAKFVKNMLAHLLTDMQTNVQTLRGAQVICYLKHLVIMDLKKELTQVTAQYKKDRISHENIQHDLTNEINELKNKIDELKAELQKQSTVTDCLKTLYKPDQVNKLTASVHNLEKIIEERQRMIHVLQEEKTQLMNLFVQKDQLPKIPTSDPTVLESLAAQLSMHSIEEIKKNLS